MRRSFHLNSFPSRLLASDFGRDAVLTFSCQIVVMLSMLLLNKILSNQLSVEGFGQYNIIRRSSAVLSFVMLGGMGIAILSTSRGIMTDREARLNRIGGEVLCYIW